jgi:hypothetical protein
MGRVDLVPLVRLSSPFEAKVLAARLGSEGFMVQLRGSIDSVYPVGDVVVLVAADELADAQALLDADRHATDADHPVAPVQRSPLATVSLWAAALAGLAAVVAVSMRWWWVS